ncbi:hypothetical protein C0J52_06692 [Blattella germanica]|nr:hypothetical protein C0J52_06692 [Blattella germanica]
MEVKFGALAVQNETEPWDINVKHVKYQNIDYSVLGFLFQLWFSQQKKIFLSTSIIYCHMELGVRMDLACAMLENSSGSNLTKLRSNKTILPIIEKFRRTGSFQLWLRPIQKEKRISSGMFKNFPL